jgi:hypothetical protein
VATQRITSLRSIVAAHRASRARLAIAAAVAAVAMLAPPARAAQTIDFTYDALGRLTSAAYGATAITYQYDASGNITRIEVVDATIVGQVDGALGLPLTFGLSEARPNPAPGAATVAYQMPRESDVRIDLFDVTGRRVRTLVRDRRPGGFYAALWDGRDDGGGDVASGVYFLRMQAGTFDQTRRLVVIK